MKVPKIFTPEREKFEKELEDIIKNSSVEVEKVLVKDIAKELEKYLENRDLAKRVYVSFEKKFDILRNPDLNTHLEKNYSDKYFLNKEGQLSLQKREVDDIVEKLTGLKIGIKDEELTHDYVNSFSILTKETAYKFFLKVIEPYHDEEAVVKEIEKKGIFGTKIKKVREVYCHVRLAGDINYAKFDKTHHETIVKILRENGYNVSVDIKKEEKE